MTTTMMKAATAALIVFATETVVDVKVAMLRAAMKQHPYS